MIKVEKWDKKKKKRNRHEHHKKQEKDNYSISQNICYILKELWKCSPIMFLCLALQILMNVANSLCETFAQKYVVELALGTSGRIRLMAICLIFIVGERLAKFLFNQSNDYESMLGAYRFNKYMTKKLLYKNMHTDYENNEHAANSDALNKAKNGSGYITVLTMDTIKDFISAILNILTFSTVLSLLDPWMILIIVVPSALTFFIERHRNMWAWKMVNKWQKYDRELDYIRSVGSDFSTAKDVRIFGMKRWFTEMFDRVYKKRLYWYQMQDAWSFRHEILRICVNVLLYASAYAFVIVNVVKGGISAGDFVLYFNAILFLSNATYNVLNSYSGFKWLSENVGYARDYNSMEEHTNREAGEPLPIGEVEISFRNVSYTYAGAKEPTIRHISFTLHKGEKLAFVGLNGAGKTTLIKLMCGLYSPTDGEILVNGLPMDMYNREAYFKLFSAVFQETSQLPVSIAENISGKRAEDTDYVKVEKCLKMAGLYEKAQSLPQGIHTRLVRSVYDNATEFSGGQSQLLALAKALYKDASVLLLDEPTASLDPIAEQEMYLRYANFSKGKSSVFISHRLASTRFCDRILLIENGEIAEEGTHAELMQLGGIYAELFALQSSYYKEKAGESL